jgi:hypothetical protein
MAFLAIFVFGHTMCTNVHFMHADPELVFDVSDNMSRGHFTKNAIFGSKNGSKNGFFGA